MKKTALNVPNTLSLIRCLLVPVFVATLIFMRDIEIWGIIVPALVYGLTAFTDMLDGKIARKYNLVTDFGKFIDPLADKFMVISSMVAIMLWMILRGEELLALVFVWVVLIILLRELGVTSLRLVVAGKSGIVVAASMLGKIKTVSQIICICAIFIEPLIYRIDGLGALAKYMPLSYATIAIMIVFTLWSGINYIVSGWTYLDPNK